jgi:hypothetical protein
MMLLLVSCLVPCRWTSPRGTKPWAAAGYPCRGPPGAVVLCPRGVKMLQHPGECPHSFRTSSMSGGLQDLKSHQRWNWRPTDTLPGLVVRGPMLANSTYVQVVSSDFDGIVPGPRRTRRCSSTGRDNQNSGPAQRRGSTVNRHDSVPPQPRGSPLCENAHTDEKRRARRDGMVAWLAQGPGLRGWWRTQNGTRVEKVGSEHGLQIGPRMCSMGVLEPNQVRILELAAAGEHRPPHHLCTRLGPAKSRPILRAAQIEQLIQTNCENLPRQRPLALT